MSIPQLTVVLPAGPSAGGRDLGITADAVLQIVSGKLPDEEDFEMTGTLLKVSRSKDGKAWSRRLRYRGRIRRLDAGLSCIRRPDRLRRSCLGVSPSGAGLKQHRWQMVADRGRGSLRRDGVVTGAGRVTYAALSHAAARTAPGADGRLKTTITSELILERRPLASLARANAPQPAPLTLPETPPTQTEANSWLTYVDPEGRFDFRHPQEFRACTRPA